MALKYSDTYFACTSVKMRFCNSFNASAISSTNASSSLSGIAYGASYKKIYFIIGADSLLYIQDWYHPEYICSHCHLLCANRDNNSASVLIDQKHFLADKYGAVIDFIDVPELPYSSTDIRKKVAMGLSVKEDVGEEVEEYIKSRKLYV